MKTLLPLFLLCLLSCTFFVEESDSLSSREIFSLNQKLGRGINFGNALEAPSEGAWGMMLEPTFFQKVKEAGFNTIRLPIRWSAHADTLPPYAIEASFFERIDWCVEQATLHNLNLIINMHHYNELDSNPEEHLARWLALWEQIATRYAQSPPSVYFELYNEPHHRLDKYWNEYLLKGLALIRKSNPTRAVIIGGVHWNNFRSLDSLWLPPNDRFLIATFHYYEPFHFTHQSASWVEGSEAWKGTRWQNTPEQLAAVERDFAQVKRWADSTNRPVLMGEFGAYSMAADEDRVLWTACIRENAEKASFSWAYWEFGAGFGIYDRERKEWRQNLLKALIP